MPATIVVGTQWGDEGKGRVTDLLAQNAAYAVRYQGGNNAGHTIVVGEERFALSLVPSGVMYPDTTPVIASGMVIDPAVLLSELEMLESRGVDPSRLRISGNAHLIMPYHRRLDAVMERYLGRNRIGTTRRGIGPAYTDKYARSGIRVQDLFDPKIFRDKLEAALVEKNRILTRVYNQLPMSAADIADEYLQYAPRLIPMADDVSYLIWSALEQGKEVLLEGAQGTLLDVDHGTYPFVTSSNPTAGGGPVGVGIGPKAIDRVVGVAKAYISRVGSGPFPTELDDETGERMVTAGGEFGTVTGRRRRCGWLDLVALRYARRVNSLTGLFLTKLDVLSGIHPLRIAIAYTAGETVHREFPRQQRTLYECAPRYEELPGWEEDISGITDFAALPAAARDYVRFIEKEVSVPIHWVSVGQERDQVITRS